MLIKLAQDSGAVYCIIEHRDIHIEMCLRLNCHSTIGHLGKSSDNRNILIYRIIKSNNSHDKKCVPESVSFYCITTYRDH